MMLLSSSSGWGSGWWGLCGAFMVVCMVMMMLMMRHGDRGAHWHPWRGMGQSGDPEPRRPEQTLADRMARGQIDIEEYERRLTALRESSEVHIHPRI